MAVGPKHGTANLSAICRAHFHRHHNQLVRQYIAETISPLLVWDGRFLSGFPDGRWHGHFKAESRPDHDQGMALGDLAKPL
jgi:hypothetical protein